MRTPFQSPRLVLGVLAAVIAAGSPGVVASAQEQDAPLRDPEWSNPPRIYVSRENDHEAGSAVTVNCAVAEEGGVTDCRAEGVPARPERLASALEGQRHWRLSPQARRDVQPGRRVVFDVRFLSMAEFPGIPIIAAPPIAAAPPAPPMPARPSVITNPTWARTPLPEYPRQALAARVHRGRVIVNCGIEPNGTLSDCRIIEEAPEDVGFGASALASTVGARLSPRSVSEMPPGARVNFTLRYVGPDAEPEPAPPQARNRTGG